MSVQIPNVICVKDLKLISQSLTEPTAIINKEPLPNMKQNRLYYVFIRDGETNRIFHIKSSMINSDSITLNLGNSFIVNNVPSFNKPIQYVPLSKFGLQQLEPGCLIEIKK